MGSSFGYRQIGTDARISVRERSRSYLATALELMAAGLSSPEIAVRLVASASEDSQDAWLVVRRSGECAYRTDSAELHGMMRAVTPGGAADGLDTSTAHQARVYDYWLGGKENYAADRAAGDAVMQAYPGIVTAVRAQRAFLGRVIRYLAAEADITQFLDIGTGIPTSDNTHEVAQAVAPTARVVYVDKDPVVLAHAHALLTSGPGGVTDYIDADLHATAAILDQAARTLDFTRPVAVMMLGILQVIPDGDDPWEIVSQLLAAVAPGSYLAIAHPAADIATGPAGEAERRYNQHAAVPVTLRTHAEVARFFAGLDLLEPGLVPVDQWRPPPGVQARQDLAIYGGVGRKPA